MTPDKPEQCEVFMGAVTVGERGQVVIPAEARKELDIHTGDKLLVMGHPSREGLVFFKVDSVREFLKHLADGLSMAEAGGEAGDEQPVREAGKSRAKRRVSKGEVK